MRTMPPHPTVAADVRRLTPPAPRSVFRPPRLNGASLRRLLPGLGLALALVFLVAGCATPKLPPPSQGDVAKWEKEIAAFERSDKTNPPPSGAILFIGSSSIKRWTNLSASFPEFQVINRGFGGSQIADSVTFADRIVIPYHPRQIVFYAGGNDLNAKKTPEQVLADFRAFCEKVHAQLPDTRICFVSIAPNPARWAQIDRVRRANRLIRDHARWHSHVEYIDAHSHMLGKDGKSLPDIFVADRLHMNARGYAIWEKVIRPYLR